jgi:predicted ribosomally synthesized peptide with SipW-like signal peptide
MNTRILSSVLIIGLVSLVIGGATLAYFSDTETSTGNRFAAGSIDLKIDYDCYYNKEVDQEPNCGTWALTDLTSEKFFDFNDVKPGDYGEGTVSLHVYDNDAYLCFYIYPMEDDDNSCVDPEVEAGDTTCGAGEGELDDNLVFRIWQDDGDNIWQVEEPFLTYCDGDEWCYLSDINPAGEVWNLGEMETSTDYYIGIEWNMPTETGNMVQGDSWSANVEFYAEQTRNNPGFSCPGIPV